jgi:gmma-aminobutyric acid receptor subunit gamma/cGMP-dependent protein kinase 2
MALLVNLDSHSTHTAVAPKCTATVYDSRPQFISQLVLALESYNWSHVLAENNINLAYQAFLNVARWYINTYIPVHQITVRPRTPSYLTPLTRLLLRRRNKLMRSGKIPEANELTAKIGKLIDDHRTSVLSNVTPSSTKQLWKLVNESRGSNKATSSLNINNQPVDIGDLNQYFADIATDPDYNPDCTEPYINVPPVDPQATGKLRLLHVLDVQSFLDKAKKTAPGVDEIPYWFIRNCSFQIAPIVTHIFNLSLRTGKPPANWKQALVTPVPKVNKPASFSDFRPISVTPLLSRIFERIIVHRYLQPSLPASEIADQYAYRTSGSTTAAMVDILHRVTNLLETNKFVRCIFFDFSKAFDTVNHPILFSKLERLSLPPTILAWIVNFLSGRTQAVKHGALLSKLLPITRSIVQGSGLGPSLYITYKSDLNPLSTLNFLVKFADDTTAIIPQNSDVPADEEVQHVRDWAHNNKLTLNLTKTKELVFYKPGPYRSIPPTPIPGIEQVTSIKSLGITLTQRLSMDEHVNNILSIISQRFYLLNQLRRQGLPKSALKVIFHSLIISRILYALPAYSGFLSAANISRLDASLRKARRWGLTDTTLTIQELIDNTDDDLFNKVHITNHPLHHLLPPPSAASQSSYDLRSRGHSLSLPTASNLFKKSFITRCLYKFI